MELNKIRMGEKEFKKIVCDDILSHNYYEGSFISFFLFFALK